MADSNGNGVKTWYHGLGAAFIGGFAGAIDSGLALILIAPETFNLNSGLRKTILTIAVLGLLTGLKCAAAYLKQSPLPREAWTDAERQQRLPEPKPPQSDSAKAGG